MHNTKELLTFLLKVLICHHKHVHLNHRLIVRISLNLPWGYIFSYKLQFPEEDACFLEIKFTQTDAGNVFPLCQINNHILKKIITIIKTEYCGSWGQLVWHILRDQNPKMHEQTSSPCKTSAGFLVFLYVELSVATLWKCSTSNLSNLKTALELHNP